MRNNGKTFPQTLSFSDLEEPDYYELNEALPEPPHHCDVMAKAEDTGKGFIEVANTTINDIPMRIYLPRSMKMSLQVGAINREDSSIFFAAQAANVRADNGGIVCAFVLNGEPLAWGLSKKGYCAIIVENGQRGKSARRALCDRNGEVFVIETLSEVSLQAKACRLF